MIAEIPHLAESAFVGVEITPVPFDGRLLDPTATTVQVALTQTQALGASPTWNAATWQTNSVAVPPIYTVTFEVGDLTDIGQLAVGMWYPFIKITSLNEHPIVKGKPFRVTP